MAVPITSAVFYELSSSGEHDIRFSRQLLGMQAIAVSELVQNFPDCHLRLCMFADVGLHVTAAARSDPFENRARQLA